MGSTEGRKQAVWLECIEWLGEGRRALRGGLGPVRRCIGHWAGFGFYPKYDGEILVGFEQDANRAYRDIWESSLCVRRMGFWVLGRGGDVGGLD